MQLRILGCSGGIGATRRTTSLLVDDDVLVDCGSGVGDLSLEALQQIRHIFLSHSHLDHVAFVPLLVDTIFPMLVHRPVTLYLRIETLNALREHIFNWEVWPDFFMLPDELNPVIRYQIIAPGQVIEINGRLFEAMDVTHTVPALGFRVESPTGKAFAYSGDTYVSDNLWRALNTHPNLELLLVECAYTDAQEMLSQMAGHHRPSTLVADLRKLRHQPEIYITHLNPGLEVEIMAELYEKMGGLEPKPLRQGEVFRL